VRLEETILSQLCNLDKLPALGLPPGLQIEDRSGAVRYAG